MVDGNAVVGLVGDVFVGLVCVVVGVGVVGSVAGVELVGLTVLTGGKGDEPPGQSPQDIGQSALTSISVEQSFARNWHNIFLSLQPPERVGEAVVVVVVVVVEVVCASFSASPIMHTLQNL